MDIDEHSNLGKRIRRYRRSLGESQETFGLRFNVKRLTVINWEKGSQPNSTHLQQIMASLESAEAQHSNESAHQFELPFDQPFELAVRMSAQVSHTIHFEVRLKTKAG